MTTPIASATQAATDTGRLLGLPFDDSDDVIRAAVAEASVPALQMSMVHMTGDMGLFDELPRPFMLIAMDLQGAMSEPDKEAVRDYKYAAGHVPTLYGFRIFDYWQWTNRPNAEDYALRHAPHEQE
jgi:hypothetical protein